MSRRSIDRRVAGTTTLADAVQSYSSSQGTGPEFSAISVVRDLGPLRLGRYHIIDSPTTQVRLPAIAQSDVGKCIGIRNATGANVTVLAPAGVTVGNNATSELLRDTLYATIFIAESTNHYGVVGQTANTAAAYAQANSAYTQANSAFTQANTATTNASNAQADATNALLTEYYVSRGDVADPDFTEANLTLDNTWRALDVSSTIPAGAKGHPIRFNLYCNCAAAAGKSIALGGSATPGGNLITAKVHVAGISGRATGDVVCNAGGYVWYRASAATDEIDIYTVGWWIPRS